MTGYVTVHPQKDGRTIIGTAMHKYKDCSTLKSRTGVTEVDTQNKLVAHVPKCFKCYNRSEATR